MCFCTIRVPGKTFWGNFELFCDGLSVFFSWFTIVVFHRYAKGEKSAGIVAVSSRSCSVKGFYCHCWFSEQYQGMRFSKEVRSCCYACIVHMLWLKSFFFFRFSWSWLTLWFIFWKLKWETGLVGNVGLQIWTLVLGTCCWDSLLLGIFWDISFFLWQGLFIFKGVVLHHLNVSHSVYGFPSACYCKFIICLMFIIFTSIPKRFAWTYAPQLHCDVGELKCREWNQTRQQQGLPSYNDNMWTLQP